MSLPRYFALGILLAAHASVWGQAQDEAVVRGGSFLKAQQKGDGSWSAGGRQLIDTVEAAVTIAEDSGQFSKTVEFLKARGAKGTDALSRKLIALALSSEDVSDLRTQLLGHQNADGSWGAQRGHRGTPLDTALALRALGAPRSLDVGAFSRAIPYLASRRLPSGGWFLQEGGSEDLFATAAVTHALGQFALDTGFVSVPLEENLVRGTAFLLSQQQGDGSFGTQDKIVATSWCILALLRTSQPASLAQAVTFLRNAQAADGSWEGDVYKTALATRAIREALSPPASPADLKVDSITFDPPAPAAGAPVFVTVGVSNVGSRAAADVQLRLEDGTAPMGPLPAFPSVPPGTTVRATVTAVFAAGSHSIRATVDPLGRVVERNTADNVLTVPLAVGGGTLPDLSIVPADITVSPGMPLAGDRVTVSAVVRNLGTAGAKNAAVSFFDGDPSAGGTKLGGDVVISRIPPSGSATASLDVSLKAGTHALFVAADRAGLIAEANEANNSASKPLTVLPSNGPLPDLAVTEFTLSSAAVADGEAVTLSARITNIGAAFNGPPVAVRFLDNNGIMIGDDFLLTSLEPGASAALSVAASFDAGTHTLSVAVDPSNVLAETFESNNQLSLFLTVAAGPLGLPDLVVDSVSVSKASLDNGEPVTLSAIVKNVGSKAATGFVVRFFDESPVGGERAGMDFAVASLPAGQQTLVQIGWTPPVGTHRIFALADATNRVAESNEGNNLAVGPGLTVSTTPFSNPQVFEETGKEFWTVAPGLTEDTALYLLADQPAAYSISGAITQNGTVGPGAPAIVIVPGSAEVSTIQQVASNKGIHITATTPIRVFQIFGTISSGQVTTVAGSTLVLPVSSLGTDYRMAGFGKPTFNAGANNILILAPEDGTSVSIQVVGTAVPQTLNFSLNQGQAFRYSASVDISGSRVTGTKPVVFVSYVIDAFAPKPGGNIPQSLLEQMMPSRLFGTRFLAPASHLGSEFHHIRLIAHEDQTEVTVTKAGFGPETTVLPAGQSKLVFTDRFTEIVSSKPVLAMQYHVHGTAPAMSLLLPTTAARRHYRLHAFHAGTSNADYAGILCPFAATDVRLNNQAGLLENSFEYFRDDIKFSYGLLLDFHTFQAFPPTLEVSVDASRPALVYSFEGPFFEGRSACPAGYCLKTSPDLFPASLSIPSGEILAGAPVPVKARIHNLSLADASGVRVRIFDGGIQVGSDLFIASLPREADSEVSTSWTPTIPGMRPLTVVVDPLNEILEADEENNVFVREVSVSSPVDIRGALQLGGSTFLSNQEVKIDTAVENLSADAVKGVLQDARLQIVIEDASGRVVSTLPGVSMPELGPVPPGLAGWKEYIEATLNPAKNLVGPSIVAVPIDFTKLLQAAGVPGPFDENSLRVVELSGGMFRERQAYLIPGPKFEAASAAAGTVEWVLPGSLAQGAARRFRIYFDSEASGKKGAVPRIVEPGYVTNFENWGFPSPTDQPRGSYALWDRKAGLQTRTVADAGNLFFMFVRGINQVSLGNFTEDGFYDVLNTLPAQLHPVVRDAVYLLRSGGSNTLVNERPAIWSRPRSNTSSAISSADLNGDGIDDLVVRVQTIGRISPETGTSENFHEIQAYLGRGDGTFFQRQDFLALGPFASSGPDARLEFDLADADGDGNIDLILASASTALGPGERVVIRVFKGIGDGTFATGPITSVFPSQAQAPNFRRTKFAAGDFTNDGKADLLFQGDGVDVRAFLSRGNGDGTFQDPQVIPNGTSHLGLFSSGFSRASGFDYNRDGNLDAFTMTTSRVRISFGDGAGGFTSHVEAQPNIGNLSTLAGVKANQLKAVLADLPRTTGAFLKDFTFNTNGLTGGAYRVRMNVLDGAGKLVFTTTRDFEVLSPLDTGGPDAITQARIITDRFTYFAGETAKLTSTAINISSNATLSNLTLKVTVSSPSSQVLFTDQKAVASILPGASFSFDSFFSIGTLAPGTPYAAKLEVLSAGQGIANRTALFSIAPTFKFAGTVAVAPASITPGQPFTINFTLQNLGNVDVSGGAARFTVTVPSTVTTLGTFDQIVSVAPGASISGSINAASTGFPPGTHLVAFQLLLGSRTFPIATTILNVQSPGCPFAKFALLGDDSVRLDGQAFTDDVAGQKRGDVFSNREVSLTGQATVSGDVKSAGPAGSITRTGRSTITGASTTGVPPIVLPSPDAAVLQAAIANRNSLIGLTGNGKNPLAGTDFTLSANDTLTLDEGTYYFTSFTVNGTLNMNGLVQIYVAGPVGIQNEALVNPTQPAVRFLLVSNSMRQVSIDGRAKVFGAVYAPRAPVSFAGDSISTGFFVGKNVVVTGQAKILLDPDAEPVCRFVEQ